MGDESEGGAHRQSDAVLSHQSAGQLFGVRFVSPQIHLTVAEPSRGKGSDVALHRSTLLPDHHVTERRGWPLTSLPRTLCDLSITTTDDSHYRALVQEAIVSGATDRDRVLDVHLELAVSGRKGSARRSRVFRSLFAEEPAITTTALERLLVGVLRSGRIEGVEWQYRPPWFDGTRGVVDAAIPAARLVIEADGRRWHATEAAFATDRARDRLAVEHGWRVLRFTWRELRFHPEAVVDSIRAVLEVPADF